MEKYLIITLPDGGLYRINLKVIQQHYAGTMAETFSEAPSCIGQASNDTLIEYSKRIPFQEIEPDLQKISHGTAMSVRLFWKEAVRQVKTEDEMEELLTGLATKRKEVDHE